MDDTPDLFQTVSFKFPRAMLNWLDRQAERTGNNRSSELRRLVAEAMREEAEQCVR